MTIAGRARGRGDRYRLRRASGGTRVRGDRRRRGDRGRLGARRSGRRRRGRRIRASSLVSVHSPPFLHERHVRIALDSGRSVLCDKPFTPSADDVACAGRRRRATRPASTCSTSSSGSTRCAAERATSSPPACSARSSTWRGRITAAGSRQPLRPYGWLFDRERGGGWIGAWASHAVDTLRFTFGEIETVVQLGAAARGRTQRPDPADPDGPWVQCTAEDGLSALLTLAGRRDRDDRLVVRGVGDVAAADHRRRERRDARERRRSATHGPRCIRTRSTTSPSRSCRPATITSARCRRSRPQHATPCRPERFRPGSRRSPTALRATRSSTACVPSRCQWCTELGSDRGTPGCEARANTVRQPVASNPAPCSVRFASVSDLVPGWQVERRVRVRARDDHDRAVEARVGREGRRLRLLERGGCVARRALLHEREPGRDAAEEPVEVGAAADRRELLADAEGVFGTPGRVEGERERAAERVTRAVVGCHGRTRARAAPIASATSTALQHRHAGDQRAVDVADEVLGVFVGEADARRSRRARVVGVAAVHGDRGAQPGRVAAHRGVVHGLRPAPPSARRARRTRGSGSGCSARGSSGRTPSPRPSGRGCRGRARALRFRARARAPRCPRHSAMLASSTFIIPAAQRSPVSCASMRICDAR